MVQCYNVIAGPRIAAVKGLRTNSKNITDLPVAAAAAVGSVEDASVDCFGSSASTAAAVAASDAVAVASSSVVAVELFV